MSTDIHFHFKSPDDSPGYLLWQLTMAWQRKIKRALDPIDLTHTQFVLLAAIAWLSKSQSEVTQVDIANQSNTDRMMVSKVLRTLEQKGLLTRKEHETDTRAKTISLTTKGTETVQQALIIVESMDVEFFKLIGNQLPTFNAQLKMLGDQNE